MGRSELCRLVASSALPNALALAPFELQLFLSRCCSLVYLPWRCWLGRKVPCWEVRVKNWVGDMKELLMRVGS